MLAVIGFITTGILFLIFASTFTEGTTKNKGTFKHYSYAYFLLAIAFMIYGLASASGALRVLSWAVLAGNVVMLAATVLITGIMFEHDKHRKDIMFGAAIIGVLLILVRGLYFYPHPYMHDSVLFFNSQRFVSLVLTAVFMLIWLPVNLQIARLLSGTKKTASLYRFTPYLFASATVSAVIFMLSKEPLPLVLSFIAIGLSFLGLISLNMYVRTIKAPAHDRK